MSIITIICFQLIILINNTFFIRVTIAISSCDLSSAINIQSATHSHSLILRVQPIYSPGYDSMKNTTFISKVLIREVIKSSNINRQQYRILKINDIIIIRINDNVDADHNELVDDSCWHLLRLSSVDVILFFNETNTNDFVLHYPPVESTLRVRQHINAVLNHETYPPKVLIKTRIDKAIVSKDYFLQCNSRGNPLPRLLWSKKSDQNHTTEYYPLLQQCKKSCRIYSIQHKYQSILYFQTVTLDDSGLYICHAENPMNHTTTSVYLNVDHQSLSTMNVTCSTLKFCHNRGHCIMINNQMKCVCENQYFGEQCETNYEELINKQDTIMLLYRSRLLAGFILFFVGFLLLVIALISWYLARNNRQQRAKLKQKLLLKPSAEKPLISSKTEVKTVTEKKDIIPSSTSIEEPPPKPPLTAIHISPLQVLEKKSSQNPVVRQTNLAKSITRESSTATEDDDDDGEGLNSFLRQHPSLPPVPTRIDEEYEERFSYKMNKSEELGLGYLSNGLNHNEIVLSQTYADFNPPDRETGLIKPLNIRNDRPQRYTKYVSSYSKFVLPRPVKSSSSEY